MKKLLIALLAVLLLDGLKSYYLASKRVDSLKARNVRLSGMIFLGVWRVTFKMDAGHPDAIVTYTVAPLAPVILGELHCK